MQYVIHPSQSRGQADHGWLQSFHSFSFAGFYDPEKIHFGALRVLNDDRVAPGRGFSSHPHENMEIISIPISGELEHRDNMGNVSVIREYDIQVMSAGTGVIHSEFNRSKDRYVEFLQIWVFPNLENVKPRYDQNHFQEKEIENRFLKLLSPQNDGGLVWIHQNAWIHLGQFDPGSVITYQIHHPDNGVYFFILDGNLTIGGHEIHRRDAIGFWDTGQVDLSIESRAKVLAIEIPME